MCPALRISSAASSSRCASTTAANDRSSRARSPGATKRQDLNAACAASIAASVSATDARGTSSTDAPVAGLMTAVDPSPENGVVTEGLIYSLSNPRRRSQSVTAAPNAASSVSAACT